MPDLVDEGHGNVSVVKRPSGFAGTMVDAKRSEYEDEDQEKYQDKYEDTDAAA